MRFNMAHKPESETSVAIALILFVILCVAAYVPWSIILKGGLGN